MQIPFVRDKKSIMKKIQKKFYERKEYPTKKERQLLKPRRISLNILKKGMTSQLMKA